MRNNNELVYFYDRSKSVGALFTSPTRQTAKATAFFNDHQTLSFFKMISNSCCSKASLSIYGAFSIVSFNVNDDSNGID